MPGVTCFGKRPARCFAAVTLIAEFYAGFLRRELERGAAAPSVSWPSVIRIVPERLGNPREIRNIAGDLKILAYLIFRRRRIKNNSGFYTRRTAAFLEV